ncbi:MAG TPA: 4-(cytidine 5'-diphospho)-2-C-methyl-D-erythritol kinase [Bacillales bacterium]|nr:4-(cytidine 5'-diphospho)-2-C-methyl-D-erythritol kinase [Bacillales bacterium]
MKLFMKAPAKINLALDVLNKRDDGYHEVKMVMTTIDLADRLELECTDHEKIRVSTSSGFLPEDHRNLAYRAAQLLQTRFEVNKGVTISIDKQIPVAAGLAGGSSDAAAVLRGLNRLWRLNLSMQELAEIGSEIGSDVAFCVYGGTAVATGRGEILSPISPPPPCWVVLAKPNVGVSTKDMYRQLQMGDIKHPDVDGLVEAIERRNYRKMCEKMENVFEPLVMKKVSQVALIKRKMNDLGADGVLMSGSGPTVFALTKSESRMRRLVNGLRGFCPNVYHVRSMGGKET